MERFSRNISAPVKTVAMSCEGQTIVAGSDNHSVYCFNLAGHRIWKYSTDGKVKSVAVSGDGNYVAAGSTEGSVNFFNRDGKDRGSMANSDEE